LCVIQEETTIAGVEMLEKPSLGVHLGHSLVKCCAVKRGIALRSNSLPNHKDAAAFAELMSIEWNNKISSAPQQTLKERKYDEVDISPIISDLVILRNYVTELVIAMMTLEKTFEEVKWKRLAELVSKLPFIKPMTGAFGVHGTQ